MMSNDKLRIRMRAWDIIQKEMHYDFQCIWIKSDNEDELPSGIIFSSDLYVPCFDKWPPENEIERKFKIMEWVHAVDEIGLPIYEHDLINVKQENEEWIGIAIWGKRGSAYCFDINKIKDNKLEIACFFDQKQTTFTVIGNIYHNREIVQHLYDQRILIDE